MYPALALVLLGLAAFTVLVVQSAGDPSGHPDSTRSPGRWSEVDQGQVRAFAYVGAGSLVVLALSVVGVGMFRPEGSGEKLAVLGLFAYVVYIAAAYGVGWWQSGARARRLLDEPVPEGSTDPVSVDRVPDA